MVISPTLSVWGSMYIGQVWLPYVVIDIVAAFADVVAVVLIKTEPPKAAEIRKHQTVAIQSAKISALSWWRHQMEPFSALLALCAGNSPVIDEFTAQRPVTRSFDVFFDLRLNKWLSKQSRGWRFETRSWSLWRHSNDKTIWWLYVCFQTNTLTIISDIVHATRKSTECKWTSVKQLNCICH